LQNDAVASLYAAEAGRGDGVLRFAGYRGMDAAVTETANEALDMLATDAGAPGRRQTEAIKAGLGRRQG
jgi:hypothetical protein